MSDRSEKIQRLFTLKNRIETIKAQQIKPIEDEFNRLKDELLADLVESGEDKISLKGVGSIGVNKAIVPNKTDWTAFTDYVRENNAFYLMNKVVNTAAFREANNMGESIPGVEPFEKYSLSVTKAA